MTESLKLAKLKISGMSCGGCAANVLRILSARPGVASASVDLRAGAAEAKYRGGETSPEILAAAVAAAGYGASAEGGAA